MFDSWVPKTKNVGYTASNFLTPGFYYQDSSLYSLSVNI